jgi:predicted nucleic acid-binding protein
VILTDTSVWIEHLRRGNDDLAGRLQNGDVLCHPFIVGELACGNLRRRSEILTMLRSLPEAPVAEHDEVLNLIERHKLMGHGLGWVDGHLIASAMLAGVALWTLDRPLATAARRVGLPGP